MLGDADLRYDAEGAAVKETIVLNEPPATGGTSWTWNIHAPGLTFTENEYGDLSFVDAEGVVQFHIPAPVAWDSSGIDGVHEPAMISLDAEIIRNGDEYTLVLVADPEWIFDAERVYPVFVDPSVTAGDTNFHAYKSDGATRTDAVHVGNSRDSGTNKYWRTQSKYSYSGLAGKQVIDASFKAAYVAGTVNAYTGGGIYEATCFGYSCYGDKLGSITVGSGNDTVSSNKLAEYYATAVDGGNFGRYITSRGAETSGVYTYKQLNTSLTLTYKSFPRVSGMTGDSPSDGGTATLTPSLSVATVDPTGDGVWVRYLVSENPFVDASTADYVSEWAVPGAINLADFVEVQPGTTYYWKAEVKDAYDGLYGVSTVRTSPIWSFTTVNEPPATPSFSSVLPASEGDGQLLVGTAPTFGFYSTDPDSAQLKATIEVYIDDGNGNPDTLASQCTSDYVTQPGVVSCALDINSLTDSVKYLVRAQTSDGHLSSGWSEWVDVEASDAIVDEQQSVVEKSLDFDHAVSLTDAIDVMSNLNYNVVGYQFENDDLFGEFYPNAEYTASDFLTEFSTDYNTAPQITSVVVEAPVFEAAAMLSLAGVDPFTITTGKPEIVAPLADGTAITEFDAAMDAAATADTQSTAGIVSPATTTTTTTAPTRWDPGYVSTRIFKSGTTSRPKIQFKNYYYWNGKVASPKVITNYETYGRYGHQLVNYYGLEFENNVWGTHWPSDETIRCQTGGCTNFCDANLSRNYLVARNYGYSYTIRVGAGDRSNQLDTNQKDSLGAYADTNDFEDACNKNSIAIGLQHPENLTTTSSTDPSFRLYISVTTAKGSDDRNVVESGIQVVSGAPCIGNFWQSRTDCMGAVLPGTFVFPGERNWRPTLARKRKWTAPNLCWVSKQYGKVDPLTIECP